jgi:hypothetical protein
MRAIINTGYNLNIIILYKYINTNTRTIGTFVALPDKFNVESLPQ